MQAATISRLPVCPVWPVPTRAPTSARRPATLPPMASPGFVARSQVLSGPQRARVGNVQSVQRGAAVKVRFFR